MIDILTSLMLLFFTFVLGIGILFFVAFRIALYMDELEENARWKRLRRMRDEE